jgi:hypothetical protein
MACSLANDPPSPANDQTAQNSDGSCDAAWVVRGALAGGGANV